MKIINGTPVSPGIAIGTALIRFKEKIKVARKRIDKSNVDAEVKNFEQACNEEIHEINNIIANYTKNDQEKELISAHKIILQDPELKGKITEYIEKDNYSAAYALQLFLKEIAAKFAEMTNSYFAERIFDYEDIINRLINRLTGNGKNGIEELFESMDGKDIILVLEDISPSDVAKSYHSNVKGICLSKGSKTSHTAIISRALGLPVVVGLTDIFDNIDDSDDLIIDGDSGKVVINPDDKTLKNFTHKLDEEIADQKALESIIDDPTETLDGKKFQLFCNIELEEEIDTVLKKKADGIGLFRTEYIFVGKKKLPTEDEQFKIYSSIAAKMGEKPVIIRTYDLGGDKLADSVKTPPENNPFLGCRGIRLSLKYPEVFKTQIKAILRANHSNNIMVMFPMVSSASEVTAATDIVEQCKKELKNDNIDFQPHIKIGAMIEIPAAVFSIRELCEVCDFFSIGTNDLVQYTLAADRDNKEVEKYYDAYHPAVIKMIAITIMNAHRCGKPVSICGEIASEPDYLPILIGLGIDSISVNPSSILSVKSKISECSYQQAKQLVKERLKNS